MSDFNQQLAEKLSQRKMHGLYRQRKVLASPQNSNIVLSGSKYISFCSNDYLGLANHPAVAQTFKDAIDLYGVGSGASHLITGHSSAHHALEDELAEFTGRSRALLFSSGYMANVGVITALLGKQDQVFEDKLNHVSLLEGGLFSGAKFHRYPHLETAALNKSLDKYQGNSGRKLIVSDGVFSMDGDVAPLKELIGLAEKHQAQLMIDDAHGFGCLGKQGGGLVASCQEAGFAVDQNNLPILVGTFGKAFGTSGAFVAGSEELIETLIQFCRPYVYTTAMAPALAAATSCSLNILQKDSWRREHLDLLITKFRDHCQSLGFAMTDSLTPIQTIIFGDVDNALKASKALEEQGIIVSAIRPPTVPEGTARLRFTFSASHTQEQLQRLLEALEKIVPFAHCKNTESES